MTRLLIENEAETLSTERYVDTLSEAREMFAQVVRNYLAAHWTVEATGEDKVSMKHYTGERRTMWLEDCNAIYSCCGAEYNEDWGQYCPRCS